MQTNRTPGPRIEAHHLLSVSLYLRYCVPFPYLSRHIFSGIAFHISWHFVFATDWWCPFLETPFAASLTICDAVRSLIVSFSHTMALFCCCNSSRLSKLCNPTPTEQDQIREQSPLPTPPTAARRPGPLTMNPVVPMPASTGISPDSTVNNPSSSQPSLPGAIVPVDPAELSQLLVEDSDSDDELESRPQPKSGNTLKLVRTHIRRHLSQDSFDRRKSRSAVGSSQEEIERRAELKRLMHKRIQDELRSEEGQGKTSQSDIASSHRRNGPSIEVLPGGGPRDNIEFSVPSEDGMPDKRLSNDRVETDAATSPTAGRLSDNAGGDRPEERRASCPDALPKPAGQHLVRERSSLPQMPPSPDLLPSCGSSTHETSSIASWRLSYSPGQLDELLAYPDREPATKGENHSQHPHDSQETGYPTSPLTQKSLTDRSPSLSRSRSSPARQGTPRNERTSVMDQSPLSTWLRSQGLRSTSPSCSGERTSEERDGSIQEAEVVYLRRCSSLQNCAVPEMELPRPEIVHLYDMDIHRQLATRAFNTPADTNSQRTIGRVSSQETSPRRHSLVEGIESESSVARETEETRERPSAKTSTGNKTGVATNSPSVYPSCTNSLEPSRETSSAVLPDWAGGRKHMLSFMKPDFSCTLHIAIALDHGS